MSPLPLRNYPLDPGITAILGIPFDDYSSFARGAAAGPAAIRAALRCDATNLCTEDGIDLATRADWQDLGDVELVEAADPITAIESAVESCLAQGARVIALGGDHSVTFPIMKAYAGYYPDLTVLHLDAHPDLYDEFQGNRFSHACPFARIMESRLARRLVQAGIRAMTPHQRVQARRFGVEVVEMKDWHSRPELSLAGPLYLSVDLDALDPAFAPGVAHPEPGGFSTREVLAILGEAGANIVGADIVELNPQFDPAGATARVAAKLLKEVAARMLVRGPCPEPD